jgi:hypothetical protein
VVPNDQGRHACVEAWDANDGRKLWTKTVFKRCYFPLFGTECGHYEYMASMTLQADKLRLTSERGREFTLDIRTRAVRVASPRASYSCRGDAGALPVPPPPTAGTAMMVGTD